MLHAGKFFTVHVSNCHLRGPTQQKHKPGIQMYKLIFQQIRYCNTSLIMHVPPFSVGVGCCLREGGGWGGGGGLIS